jgi:hypothetical protein
VKEIAERVGVSKSVSLWVRDIVSLDREQLFTQQPEEADEEASIRHGEGRRT